MDGVVAILQRTRPCFVRRMGMIGSLSPLGRHGHRGFCAVHARTPGWWSTQSIQMAICAGVQADSPIARTTTAMIFFMTSPFTSPAGTGKVRKSGETENRASGLRGYASEFASSFVAKSSLVRKPRVEHSGETA